MPASLSLPASLISSSWWAVPTLQIELVRLRLFTDYCSLRFLEPPKVVHRLERLIGALDRLRVQLERPLRADQFNQLAHRINV